MTGAVTSGTDISILMAASEAVPFAKTGGLGDVLGGLPAALAAAGNRVRVAIPFYREAAGKGLPLDEVVSGLKIPMGDALERVSVRRARLKAGHEALFIVHGPSFDRPHLYGPPGKAYPDNGYRFALFSRAVVRLAETLGDVDLIHCHDWQTGLIPLFSREVGIRSLFTIHNLGYQGLFDEDILDEIGLGRDLFHPEGLEFHGRVNYLKAGIVWSDAVTTVSPTYSREIRTPEHGFGLDGLIRKHSRKVTGILNGVDYTSWDPGIDPLIAANYTLEDPSGKADCRRDLLDTFPLPPGEKAPIIGVVTRLVHQKGLKLIIEGLPRMMNRKLSLIILGSGLPKFEEALMRAASRYPNLAVRLGFDEMLAHRIEAGADIFLMPSLYEPCGLNQIYSLKYGTIPVVRATGGLKDTVKAYNPLSGEGTGFTFEEAGAAEMVASVREAVRFWRRPTHWRRIVRNAMSADYSWSRSAGEYRRLYRRILAAPGV